MNVDDDPTSGDGRPHVSANELWDAVVIGAGPAGSLAALHLALGETIGTTLSITGEAIGKAMESAELAAAAAHRYLATGVPEDLLRYGEAVKARLRQTFRAYERAQRWLRHPWVVDLRCRQGIRNPRYTRLIAGVMADTMDPSRVFSVRALLGSFLH
jgi:flavin-dependent dehydrogenase